MMMFRLMSTILLPLPQSSLPHHKKNRWRRHHRLRLLPKKFPIFQTPLPLSLKPRQQKTTLRHRSKKRL
jgi:hypothetical protein